MNFDPSYILLFAAVVIAVYGVASLFEKKATASVLSIRRGATAGWFTPLIVRFAKSEAVPPKDETRLLLLQAGYEASDAVQTYQAVRIALAIALPVMVLALLSLFKPDLAGGKLLLCAALALFVGLIAPKLYISSRRSQRQQAVREGLPDILDLLLVTTEAGLGLDTAVLRVGEEALPIHPVIASHLLHLNAELRAGRPRAEAFYGFADRCGIQETTSMVNLLVQSDHLGTSMASALRTFAEDMRAHRLLKAEEFGQKIAVKLTMVMAAFFLPALLITIAAPIAITLVDKLTHLR